MLLRSLAVNPTPRVISASVAMTGRDISSADYTHWVVDTAAQTITLPTPIKDLAGKFQAIVNASSGICTLSGAFAGGASSAVMEAKDNCLLVCLPTASGTFKWCAIGLSAPLTGITETVQDIIGTMCTSNTETNISVTYDDATGKLNFSVSGVETADSLGTLIAGATAKATPIDADLFVVADTADTNDAKKVTVAQARSVLLAADPLGSVVNGLSAKVTPIDADLLLLADTADTNDAKKLTFANARTALLAADPLGGVINGLSGKTTPIDADMFIIADSADTNDAKKVTGANLKTYIGTPVKASGAEINAGSDDAKFVTAKAIADSELVAVMNSVNWQDWAPTIASVPATDTLVARYQRIGQSVRGYIDARGSDGDGWTPSTISLPVAALDVNAEIPIRAYQSVNGAKPTDMLGVIDAETNLRIEFYDAAACTDTQAWWIKIWFEYEVAAS